MHIPNTFIFAWMMNPVFNLLFGQDESNLDVPLFKSQTQLAEQIQKLNPKYKNLNSLKTYLNRVVRGLKPPSDAIKEAIYSSVKERIRDSKKATQIIASLESGFSEIEKHREVLQTQLPIGAEAESGALEEAMKKAKYHLIIRDDPAELDFSDRANIFKEKMVSNLGIWPEKSEEENSEEANGEEDIVYEFYVGSRERAKMFWLSLSQYLKFNLELSDDYIHDQLSRVNSNNSKQRLHVYTILPIIATSRFSIYDINDTQKRKAFVVNYHESGTKVSVSAIPGDKIEGIYEHVYTQIKLNPSDYGVEDVPYKIYSTNL